MPSPEAGIVHQLAACNARDIAAFMATWHDDARYFAHSDSLLARGLAEIRARYVARFQEPDLSGELLGRFSSVGPVVDRGIAARNFPEGRGKIDVNAVDDVEGDKIAKAWFRQGTPVLDQDP